MPRSIDFSRATASAIWSSSSLLALTAIGHSPSCLGLRRRSGRAAVGSGPFHSGGHGPRRAARASRFAAAERGGDQLVGKDEPRIRHVVERHARPWPLRRFGRSSPRIRAPSPSTPTRTPRKRLRPSIAARRARSSRALRRDARSRSGAPAADRAPARISRGDRRDRSDRRHRAPATTRAMPSRIPRCSSSRRAARPSSAPCSRHCRRPARAPRATRARAAPVRRSKRRVRRRRYRRSRAAPTARPVNRRSGVPLRRSQMSSSVGYLSFRYVPGLYPRAVSSGQVIKKSGSRAGPTLTNRSNARSL